MTSFPLTQPRIGLPDDAGPTLLRIARSALHQHWGDAALQESTAPWLAVPSATFVTLVQAGDLRGCVGSLAPRRPLGEDVHHNALAAAFLDDRFPPLERDELDATRIEVSLLSTPEAVDAPTREHAVAALRRHVDGVILESGGRRATYLPQVWEHFTHADDFLASLHEKAGLPGRSWLPGTRLWRYGVTRWTES